MSRGEPARLIERMRAHATAGRPCRERPLLRRSASRQARARRLPERRRPAARRLSRARAAARRLPRRLPRARRAVPELAERRAGHPRSRPAARSPTASTATRSSASSSVRPQLNHLKIALLADWRHSVKDLPLPEFLERVHGGRRRAARSRHAAALAPRLLRDRARRRPADRDDVLLELAARGDRRGCRQRLGLHLLVSAYGKSGTVGPPDHSTLAPVLQTLRARTDVPIAVGFGVKNQATSKASARSAPTQPSSAARVSPASRTRLPTDATSSKISTPSSSSWARLPRRPRRGCRRDQQRTKEGGSDDHSQADEVKNVQWGNGTSHRFLLEADGMGYTVTDTIVARAPSR